MPADAAWLKLVQPSLQPSLRPLHDSRFPLFSPKQPHVPPCSPNPVADTRTRTAAPRESKKD
ncbi:hypothetical protein M431DRAFT_513806 [Trichoderma harzianum CBS 226.95]|uniref:Uncharacterized protein n=1 Tax=Trichoderma harzianum CBS 226.95 TaxID=983964 RepID=A0A2T3ZTW7_TRIHA|nr:hypothetical protein M431DRAFT_513806 [Trichoderma harzianum CBS 226.95]PTB48233.1 hypothetical protein M431DRAFT_513806 [Trichoderma harzianum CBS 226.95]